ncbi:MAG: hypothetical protein V2A76_12575, partial [Planctomycetota bacterium]
MKTTILIPLCLLTACSFLPPEPIDDLNLQEQADRVAVAVAQIRDLAPTSGIPVAEKTKDQVREVMEQEIEEDWQTEGAGLERAYRAFGLIPEDLDLKPFLVEFMKDNVGGYYDPEKKEFFTVVKEEGDKRDSDDEFDADTALVLPHELMHALEDQHFNLEALEDDKSRDEDEDLAFSSLVEGSAMEGGVDHILWRFGYPGSIAGPLFAPVIAMLSDLRVGALSEAAAKLGDDEKNKKLA